MKKFELCKDAISTFREMQKRNWSERKDLNRMWDICLVFDDGHRFLCSQRDLGMMSPYFAIMFESGFEEAHQTEIAIRGTEGSLMEQMVAFFYTYEVCHNMQASTRI
jgi:BTB/POZ domain